MDGYTQLATKRHAHQPNPVDAQHHHPHISTNTSVTAGTHFAVVVQTPGSPRSREISTKVGVDSALRNMVVKGV